MAGITHFNKVSGINGVYTGAEGSEVQIADASGSLYIGGVAITATAAEVNAAAGTGVSSTELDLLDGALAGTAVASKALALGATKNVDTLVIADGGLYLGAGAGTSVTSTAAELNILDGVGATAAEINAAADVSAWNQTIVAAGAQVVTAGKKEVLLNNAAATIASTIANASLHAGWFLVKAGLEPAGGQDHTCTITTGTWDGTNKIATFADVNDALVIYFDTTGNGSIIANVGAVVLS